MPEAHRVTPEEYAAAVDAVEAVAAASRAADGQDPLDEAARMHLQHHGLESGSLFLSDGGFAQVRPLADEMQLDLAVAPLARRTGRGRELLDAVLAAYPGRLLAWSHADHPGAAALAAATGFARSRELLVMARDLDPATSAPADDRIRSWHEDDVAEVLRVNAAAFAHHPEQGAMDAAGLAERMDEPWFDPEGLLLAEGLGGHLLGFHWTKVHPGGHGEVYVLGIDPAAQGQGLGRLLTDAGLAHLARRGCHRVHLYVEATNTAALALYRGRGFTTDHTHVQYTR